MFGLLFVGLLYSLTAIGGSIGRWVRLTDPDTDLSAPLEALVRIVGNNHSLTYLMLSLFGALLLFASAFLIWRKSDYWLTFGALILCCVPFHPLSVLSFVFGVWGLIALNLPAAQETFASKRPSRQPSALWFAAIPLLFMLGFAALWFVYSQARVVKSPVVSTSTNHELTTAKSDSTETSAEASDEESTADVSVEANSEPAPKDKPEEIDTPSDIEVSVKSPASAGPGLESSVNSKSIAVGVIFIISVLAFVLVMGTIILLLFLRGMRRN